MSCVASGKPSMRSTCCPFLNSMMVGNASILYLDAMLGYFSVLIFTSFTSSQRLPAAQHGCNEAFIFHFFVRISYIVHRVLYDQTVINNCSTNVLLWKRRLHLIRA